MTVLELFLDVDGDGLADYRVRSGPEMSLYGGAPDRGAVAVTPWDGASDVPAGPEMPAGNRTVDLHTHATVVSVPVEALGRSAPFAFRFWARNRGLGEDWLGVPNEDVLPDDAEGPCGGHWLEVDPGDWGGAPATWSVAVDAGGGMEVERAAASPSGRVSALMALVPTNPFGRESTQALSILEGSSPEPPRRGGCLAFLPTASKHHVWKVTAADEIFGVGLDAIATVDYVKLEHNLIDYVDAHQGARRTYRFRSPDGMRFTYAPLDTDYYWDYIRVGAEAWSMRHREGQTEPWHCVPVDEWMLFWPEFLAKFRAEFPAYGWRIDSRQSIDGRDTWVLLQDSDAATTFRSHVDVETGLTVLLSRYAPGQKLDVYKLYDFGVRNIGLSKPREYLCP
jgi:hypothetical protein